MTNETVAADPFSTTPRAARTQSEDTFGTRLRGWIVRSGATFTDVARMLAIRRERLYDILEGHRPFNGAWLPLLPPAVLRVALEDLAGGIGEQLSPRPELNCDRQDDRRQLADLVREAGDVLRVAAESQADGYLAVNECDEELREIQQLERVLAARKARLHQVRDERGAPVRSVPRHHTKASG